MRQDTSLLPVELAGAGYVAGGVEILRGIDLMIATGAPTVVMGPNGSGKTTLLKLAMGLIAPTAGVIRRGGGLHASARAGFVFQKPVMLRRSAAANVRFALRAAGRNSEPGEVAAHLSQVGLEHLGDRPARRLSGGEQQKLALARVLARAPELIFLDEPTASLDPAATKAVEDIVERAVAAGIKVVMATHDAAQARRLAGEVVLLVQGRIAEHAPADRFFDAPASRAGVAFLNGEIVL